MFKQKNSEQELYDSMSSNLHKQAVESNLKFDKLSKVIYLLNKAAEILEKHKLLKQSEKVVAAINNIANL